MQTAREMMREEVFSLQEKSLATISVIIPFSKPATVGHTIESVISQAYPQEKIEIIVVGKGSSELVGQWPEIIPVDEGPIFRPGKARNLGAAVAKGDVLLFLDDDCEAQANWIDENLAELEQPDVGAVSGIVEGKSKRYFAQGVDFANFSLCQIQQRQERALCTASFAMRRDVFDQIGGFDETMKVHEDIDICHRIQMAGLKTVYQPKVMVLHNHGRETLSSFIRYMYYGGNVGGLDVEERYQDQSGFYRFLLRFRHPFVYLMMLLPFACAATLQTIRTNLREHKKVLLLSPAIFLGKLSCHIGILRSIWRVQSRDSSILREVGRLLRYTFFKRKFMTPKVLALFVTSRCNAKCEHCFYWRSLNRQDELSFPEIEKLSRALGKIDVLLISGGEPFLRSDLTKICELFIERNDVQAITIPTNGLLPELIYDTMKRILTISRCRSIHLSISIDGLASVHDAIRGVPGNFDKAAETYQILLPLRAEYPNMNLRINSTVFDRNYSSLEKLFDEYRECFPGVDAPTLSLLRGDPREDAVHLPSEPQLRALLERKHSEVSGRHAHIGKFLERLIFELALESLRRKTQILPCEAGRIAGVVDANGDVRHCELLPPIGNLREESFGEIWGGKTASVEREKIVSGDCHCTHECFLYPSLLAHPFVGFSMSVKMIARKIAR